MSCPAATQKPVAPFKMAAWYVFWGAACAWRALLLYTLELLRAFDRNLASQTGVHEEFTLTACCCRCIFQVHAFCSCSVCTIRSEWWRAENARLFIAITMKMCLLYDPESELRRRSRAKTVDETEK